MAPGYIYVLENPNIPGLVKIGRTTRAPEERAYQLSSETGVPGRYHVACSELVKDVEEAEKHVHRHLNSCRFDKEFFRIPVEDAINKVKKICSNYPFEGSRFGEISPEKAEEIKEARRGRKEFRTKINAVNEREWQERQKQNRKENEKKRLRDIENSKQKYDH